MPGIHWFRRDLRLSDNPALAEACASDASSHPGSGRPARIVGLFVLDPGLWEASGSPRRDYLAASLRALDAQLGGRLVVRVGDPALVLPRVAREVGAPLVHAAESFEPYGRRRDAAVTRRLHEDGVALRTVGSPYAVPPGRVMTGRGTPYRVFTPYRRAWIDHGWPAPTPTPGAIEWIDLPRDPLPPPGTPLAPAGELAATARWSRFLRDVERYDRDRNRPDLDATSRMSPALKWGEVHPRTLLADLWRRDGDGARAFVDELAWREFHADVLLHRPQAAHRSIRPVLPPDSWTPSPLCDAWFDAWSHGATGYPLVDAGMRQLRAEGWMHGRVRMVVGSFLVKDLHIPWQRGAAHFMRHLLDGDPAQNQLNWQWVAGTGSDAAPYFRIFNPTAQGLAFDPHGDYVRRWVPELREVEGRAVHEPWRLRRPPTGYPARIVDHAAQRERALANYSRGKDMARGRD